MTIAEKQAEIIEDFSFLEEWEERFKFVMDLGKEMADFPEELRTEDNKLHGCQSQVWLHGRLEDDRVHFHADSDSALVKGLVALLLTVYSGERPDDILTHPPTFLEKIGMNKHLTPNRANRLAAMIKQIRVYALGFQQVLDKQQSG